MGGLGTSGALETSGPLSCCGTEMHDTGLGAGVVPTKYLDNASTVAPASCRSREAGPPRWRRYVVHADLGSLLRCPHFSVDAPVY